MVLEVAETGANVSKEEFEKVTPDRRVELINGRHELQQAGFPVIVLIGADDRIAADELIDTLNERMDARYMSTRWFNCLREEESAHQHFWRYWRDLLPKGQSRGPHESSSLAARPKGGN
jgi:polyphosphate kinase 2 (PPK2 family)